MNPSMWLLALAAALVPAQSMAYTANTVWWAEDQLPVPIELVSPGSDDLGMDGTEEVVLAALDAWTQVACTSLEYEYRGWVDEVVPDDGVVQIQWVEEAWVGSEDMAGATAIQIDPFEERIVDVNLMLNGEYITWATEESNPYLATKILDVQAVLVHEIGHIFGLDHNDEMIEATMFWGYVSAAGGYLSWDDKWGICSLYPGTGDECEVDEDCPAHPYQSHRCREIEELGRRVCEEVYDELGGCCDAHWNNCAGAVCHIHPYVYEGYCSEFCLDETECPPGWTCEEVTFIGEKLNWCVSPLATEQPCGDEFEWPADDDDSAGADDDDSAGEGDDDSEPGDDDSGDGGGGCECSASGPGISGSVALAALLLTSLVRRRYP